LIEQDLVDGYLLFVNPILLGRGIPLFTGIQNKTFLELVSTKPFACGVTELNYTVNRG
ncbi:MAG: dihydrofolate reductase, partial [Chitinophagaceae bacterium]